MRDALLSTDDASQSRGAAATPEHVQPGHGQPVNKSVEVTPEAVAVGEPLDADHKFRVAPGADPGPGELHVPEELAATAHDLVHNFHAVVSGLAPLVHSGLLSGDQVSTCVEMLCDELKSTVPLLGEDMSDEQIRCLFKNADTRLRGMKLSTGYYAAGTVCYRLRLG